MNFVTFATCAIRSRNREPILPSSRPGESADSLVVGDERAASVDGAGYEQSVGGVTMLQMVQIIGECRSPMVKRHCFKAGAAEKSLHPSINRQIELNGSLVNEHRDFPHADCAQKDSTTGLPGRLYRLLRCLSQANVAVVQPQRDVRIEQQVAHRRISAPVSASISSSKTGCVRSTPARTRTEPALAPKSDPFRADSSIKRRTAVATSSVLLPPVNSFAAFSMRATTSGRLMVTTVAMTFSPYVSH